jgi:hypothetical protein
MACSGTTLLFAFLHSVFPYWVLPLRSAAKNGSGYCELNIQHRSGCRLHVIITLLWYSKCRRLGRVDVSVLATGPKGRGFEPNEGDGFLRARKIRSTPTFGCYVNQEVPCPEDCTVC